MTSNVMTSGEFAAQTNVSRETLARLKIYAALLTKWQRRMNLVGTATIPDLWRRHFWDSAQLARLLPSLDIDLLDFGSGAGFPGLVLAVMGVRNVHLVEANTRKCAFLREVARETGVNIHIHNARIEDLTPWSVDVVTARALAPLSNLIEFSLPYMVPSSLCLFLKGKRFKDELTDAEKLCDIRVYTSKSSVDPEGVILQVKRLDQNGVPNS
jgi:16S rRNA (guanine527-N7)-methyltransferase